MTSCPSPLRRARAALAGLALLLGAHARAADDAPRRFHLPADVAENSLERFSAESGVEVVFSTAEVGRVPTNAVDGTYPPLRALELLIAGTGLRARQDPRTGALVVTTGPNVSRAAPAGAGGRPDDDIGSLVQLNPFEVQADSDRSYGALNSRSITAFDAALDRLPVSADIFDQAFMKDVAATMVEDMIQSYSAGVGMNGMDDSFSGDLSKNQPGDRVGYSFMQMRGLPTPTIQRDSLLTVGAFGAPGSSGFGFTSNFDVERVELINGPQSLLYDGGGAGGVINLVSKQAWIGRPAFGSYEFRLDQYGSKLGQLDFGASQGPLAVRVAVLNSVYDTRRVNIGGKLDGAYAQAAAQAGNTTVRLTLEQTSGSQDNGSYLQLDSAGDPNFSGLNGASLGSLLATGRAGGLLGGGLNWSNVNSLQGVWSSASNVDEFVTVEADSRWTSWLSSQISAGYNNYANDFEMSGEAVDLYSPGASGNPIPGGWTVGDTGTDPGVDQYQAYRNKALRATLLATNDFLGGTAHSQTTVGADYLGNRGANLYYDYYEADSNWNVIVNPAVKTNGGRTLISGFDWPVNGGPDLYPLFNPRAPRITLNGVNYVREQTNPMNPALATPGNPLGATLVGGEPVSEHDLVNEGVYAINYTNWLSGKLDTLAGIRPENAYEYAAFAPSNATTPNRIRMEKAGTFNFSAGADYHLLPWLTPYVSASNSYNMPPDLELEPYDTTPGVAKAFGWEAGLKFENRSRSLSGSLAYYHSQADNEEFAITGDLQDDIDPSGLNGALQRGAAVTADTESQGVQINLTASPTSNWRMRLSAAFTDGTFKSTASYPEVYNDQFYENSAGDVTYQDGTVVYVPATFNSKALTVPAGTAGAVPLTVALLSTPGGSYFADPQPVTGQILSTSNAAKVLKVVDPAHGPILTGAVGLPMSDYQLDPALSGVAPAGNVVFFRGGNATVGYPEFAANLTQLYEFPSGWAKGFRIGGTVSASWRRRAFYYYPDVYNGSASEPQAVFSYPTLARFDLIFGYSRKLARITWSSQVNVENLLNHYDVMVFPNVLTGWTTLNGLRGNFDQQPREWVWTNTISF